MSEPAFDGMAQGYDREFSFSTVGKLQRARVWRWLKRDMPTGKSLDVLELNGGTGIDAWWLTERGHRVTLTDQSQAMLDQSEWIASDRLTRIKSDFLSLENKVSDHAFDLVLSNFGGLNCVDLKDLAVVSEIIDKKLRKGGRFIGVFLADKCLMERIYFGLKGDERQNRRAQGKDVATLAEGKLQAVWYHSNAQVKSAFRQFKLLRTRPIGLFIPPSYLESWVNDHMLMSYALVGLDTLLASASWAASYADHVYFAFEKR